MLHLSHTTMMRCVRRYAPEFEKCWASFARKVGRSWRVDETYLKVRVSGEAVSIASSIAVLRIHEAIWIQFET